jgi:hypothetical protein
VVTATQIATFPADLIASNGAIHVATDPMRIAANAPANLVKKPRQEIADLRGPSFLSRRTPTVTIDTFRYNISRPT